MKKFTYQFEIEHEEYSPKNCKKVFGSEECHNPDFSEDVFLADKIGQVFQDAFAHLLAMEVKAIARMGDDESKWTEGDKRFLKYIRAKQKFTDKMRDSIKLIDVK